MKAKSLIIIMIGLLLWGAVKGGNCGPLPATRHALSAAAAGPSACLRAPLQALNDLLAQETPLAPVFKQAPGGQTSSAELFISTARKAFSLNSRSCQAAAVPAHLLPASAVRCLPSPGRCTREAVIFIFVLCYLALLAKSHLPGNAAALYAYAASSPRRDEAFSFSRG